ncbi:XXYS1_4_G0015330.mRNA.1.CDS.1 [Saccharomyces cerevisiae]|nr:XXYS1_4_G0002870.mRNA.1.CDS.1 [Saccharomyces cerevisiae]CAD6639543.1 EM14S01-3B_G0025400.mRNA.1.CDS.1 [Saccharomyces cerevisiae]CAD6642433.1 XXYS1_4_G0027990.mRNA.1.CDS.1 [Saccharomyces cerevisiae]CAD6644908.1 XXYS1_4_G0015330.mRNA.1.CDS.1 [Saccharomyces cerevisiae]CAI4652465.1 AMH_1a_G0043330.mRNA.1.CDS.1 [Saccharomyces cerevisiae]
MLNRPNGMGRLCVFIDCRNNKKLLPSKLEHPMAIVSENVFISLVGAIERNISSQYYITSAIYLQCYVERLACPPFQSFLLHLYTDREKFEQPHGERVGK